MKVVRFTNIFNLKNNEDVVWFALEVEITSKNISHFLTFNFGAWESYEVGYDKIQRASSESFYQEFSSFEKQIIFTFTNRNFLHNFQIFLRTFPTNSKLIHLYHIHNNYKEKRISQSRIIFV